MMKKNKRTDNADHIDDYTDPSGFLSVDHPIVDKDIRAHHFEEDDFNVRYTDSTDVFSAILSQFNDPQYQYAFVLNDPSRQVTKKLEGYEIVDPQLIGSRKDLFTDEDKNRIVAGDLVLMRRHKTLTEKADNAHRQTTRKVLSDVLSNVKHRGEIANIENPFSE